MEGRGQVSAGKRRAESSDCSPPKKVRHNTDRPLYYERNGLRCVRPYYFTFTTHAKGRWLGSTVYDVFVQEFQSETAEYYDKAIKSGKVTVNGRVADLGTIIRNNDLICHRVHRHEPPVIAGAIPIIHQDDDLIVVNKPPSMPVHPCGRYRHNTVVSILKHEQGFDNLHTIHRLDRLTSGLLLFSKSLKTAQSLEQQIRDRLVVKQYLCRVHGEFPNDPVQCSEPILVVSHKVGVCRVHSSGKPSETLFTRLSYNGDTSLVKCEPKSGRMHQIRVHLQWLGYPIVGDPLYGHVAWGPKRGCKGEGVGDIEEVIEGIIKTSYAHSAVPTDPDHARDTKSDQVKDTVPDHVKDTDPDYVNDSDPDRVKNTGPDHVKDSDPDNVEGIRPDDDQSTDPNNVKDASQDRATVSHSEVFKDPDCTECSLNRADPTADQLLLYLHALSYSGRGWEYCTPYPVWAQQ